MAKGRQNSSEYVAADIGNIRGVSEQDHTALKDLVRLSELTDPERCGTFSVTTCVYNVSKLITMPVWYPISCCTSPLMAVNCGESPPKFDLREYMQCPHIEGLNTRSSPCLHCAVSSCPWWFDDKRLLTQGFDTTEVYVYACPCDRHGRYTNTIGDFLGDCAVRNGCGERSFMFECDNPRSHVVRMRLSLRLLGVMSRINSGLRTRGERSSMPELLAFAGQELKHLDSSGCMLHKWLEIHVRVATLHMCYPWLVCFVQPNKEAGASVVLPDPTSTEDDGVPGDPVVANGLFNRLSNFLSRGTEDTGSAEESQRGSNLSPSEPPPHPPPAQPPQDEQEELAITSDGPVRLTEANLASAIPGLRPRGGEVLMTLYGQEFSRTTFELLKFVKMRGRGVPFLLDDERCDASFAMSVHPTSIGCCDNVSIVESNMCAARIAEDPEPQHEETDYSLARADLLSRGACSSEPPPDSGLLLSAVSDESFRVLSSVLSRSQPSVTQSPLVRSNVHDDRDTYCRHQPSCSSRDPQPMRVWFGGYYPPPLSVQSARAVVHDVSERGWVNVGPLEEGLTHAAEVVEWPDPIPLPLQDDAVKGTGFVMEEPKLVMKSKIRKDLLLSGMSRKQVTEELGVVTPQTDEEVWDVQPGCSVYQKEGIDVRKFAVQQRRKSSALERQQAIADMKVLGEDDCRYQFHYLISGAAHSAKMYAAASHRNNILHAISSRHYKTTLPQPNDRLFEIMDEVSRIMTVSILMDIYRSSFAEEFLAKLQTGDVSFKSGKWSLERWRKQLRANIIEAACVKDGEWSDFSILRDYTNKGNEANSKFGKTRGLCAAGDRGCCYAAAGGVGFVEQILTRIEQYEMRSIKHTDVRGIGKRIKDLINTIGHDGFVGNDDFASYDGSARQYVERRVCIPIIEKVCEKFLDGLPLSEAAIADLKKTSLKARIEGNWRFKVPEGKLSRESGDRGTSLKNLLINKFLFMTAMAMERLYQKDVLKIASAVKTAEQEYIEQRWFRYNHAPAGYDALNYDLKPADWPLTVPWVDVEGEYLYIQPYARMSQAEKQSWNEVMEECRHWSHSAMPRYREMRRHADIMCEGDDGLQLFSRTFIRNAPPGFGKRWVMFYRGLGFTLEPQTPFGEVPAHKLDGYAVRPVLERIEFISRIWVPVTHETASGKVVKDVWSFPKPGKCLTKALVSFAVDLPQAVAGYTKYFAMMGNCIDCPLLYSYARMHTRKWAERGGHFNAEALTNMQNKRLVSTVEDDLEARYQNYTLSGASSDHLLSVEKAFAFETGITVEKQHELVVLFDAVTCNYDAVSGPLLSVLGVFKQRDILELATKFTSK